jgi:hypothetical protein
VLEAFSSDVVPSDCRIGIVPSAELSIENENISSHVYYPQQLLLPKELSTRIIRGKAKVNEITQYLDDQKEKKDNHLLAGTGCPEYIVYSRYSIDDENSEANIFKHTPPADIEVKGSVVITSNREKIKQQIEQIKNLHASVFESQTVQTGYYGGLSEEQLEYFIDHEEFVPIVAYDRHSLDVQLFALFSPRFNDYSAIEWLNAGKIQGHIASNNYPENVALPLVITSKMNGVGLMGKVVKQCISEFFYRNKSDDMSVLYQYNGLSIGFTPKIMNRILESVGCTLDGSDIEVTSYSQ